MVGDEKLQIRQVSSCTNDEISPRLHRRAAGGRLLNPSAVEGSQDQLRSLHSMTGSSLMQRCGGRFRSAEDLEAVFDVPWRR